ncbi:hypothetical protein NKG94_16065 [Micromonospora sp. M12]
MNTPLLFWASQTTGDDRYAAAARRHTAQLRQHILRPDGTTFHTFYWDPDSGVPLHGETEQGHADHSCWAGAGMGHLRVQPQPPAHRRSALLTAAMTCADRFLAHLPNDHVAYWDLEFGDGSGQERDSSAAAIAVCGLLELANSLTDPASAGRYRTAAAVILRSLIDHYSTGGHPVSNALILHGVYDKPKDVGVDEGTLWGDYFYLEALTRATIPGWTSPGDHRDRPAPPRIPKVTMDYRYHCTIPAADGGTRCPSIPVSCWTSPCCGCRPASPGPASPVTGRSWPSSSVALPASPSPATTFRRSAVVRTCSPANRTPSISRPAPRSPSRPSPTWRSPSPARPASWPPTLRHRAGAGRDRPLGSGQLRPRLPPDPHRDRPTGPARPPAHRRRDLHALGQLEHLPATPAPGRRPSRRGRTRGDVLLPRQPGGRVRYQPGLHRRRVRGERHHPRACDADDARGLPHRGQRARLHHLLPVVPGRHTTHPGRPRRRRSRLGWPDRANPAQRGPVATVLGTRSPRRPGRDGHQRQAWNGPDHRDQAGADIVRCREPRRTTAKLRCGPALIPGQ